MKKKLLQGVLGLMLALLLGVGVFVAKLFYDLNREDPHASPAPDAPEAPRWNPQQAANAAIEPSKANPGPSPGNPETPAAANHDSLTHADHTFQGGTQSPVWDIPGITYLPCPVEFADPLGPLRYEIPEVPGQLLGPSPPIAGD